MFSKIEKVTLNKLQNYVKVNTVWAYNNEIRDLLEMTTMYYPLPSLECNL
jgi:hypothetical protein